MGADLRPVLEAGDFLFGVGHASDCRAQPESCAALTVAVSEDYQPACQVSESTLVAIVVNLILVAVFVFFDGDAVIFVVDMVVITALPRLPVFSRRRFTGTQDSSSCTLDSKKHVR